MEAEALKIDLIDKIEHADDNQLKQIYGLVTNYFNGLDETGSWDTLSEVQQKLIMKSIEQADAGLVTPVEDVIKRSREKYGLNG
ncbi:MAG: hypothetical protein V4560_19460 [Bacteroidota bacterium]